MQQVLIHKNLPKRLIQQAKNLNLINQILINQKKVPTEIKDIEDKIPDIINLATNTSFNAKINQVENEIPSFTNLGITAALNTKINEVKKKMLNISNAATNTALTTVESKIPDHS